MAKLNKGLILRISPYSVRMQENTGQKNSEYGQFSRSVMYINLRPVSRGLIGSFILL